MFKIASFFDYNHHQDPPDPEPSDLRVSADIVINHIANIFQSINFLSSFFILMDKY